MVSSNIKMDVYEFHWHRRLHTPKRTAAVTIMTACFFWRAVIGQLPPGYQCNQRVRNTVKNNSGKGKFFFFSNYSAP